MKKLAFRQSVGDMVLLFFDVNGTIALNVVPAALEGKVDLLSDEGQDSMAQLSLLGDARFSCYSSGQTMRIPPQPVLFACKGKLSTRRMAQKESLRYSKTNRES